MAGRRRPHLLPLGLLLIFAMALAGLLSAEAEAAPDQTPPVADAGPDQLIFVVMAIHLDGSGSTDDVAVAGHVWTFEYGGGTVTLEGEHAYFLFEVHGNYTVTLTVTDEAGNSDTDTVRLEVYTPPGRITSATLIPRDGWVELAWSPPEDEGGTNVTGTMIFRGTNPDELVPWTSDWYMRYWHWDPYVENGLTYYYAFAAINAVGMGPLSDVYNSTPMAVPATPRNLTVRHVDGAVHLSWEPPAEEIGRVPVTGYEVHRGTDPDWLYDTFDVGMNTTFVDTGVREGRTYYYVVGASSELGSGNVTEVMNVTVREPVEEGSLVTVVVVLVPLVLMMAVMAWWYRRT